MKKKFGAKAATLAIALLMISGLSACGQEKRTVNMEPTRDLNENGTIKKPEKIKLVTDTCLTEENKRTEFAEEYEKFTGIKLEIEQPAHNQYYEKVNLSFAGGQAPDALEVGNTYYPNYAYNRALFDMTDAWEKSALKQKGIVQEEYVDALKIQTEKDTEPRLYGFPMTAGNGTVTYVRQDWLDKLGLDHPTNYDEFIDMLQAFKDNIPSCEAPLTAAGLIYSEAPYDIYLTEFYQDAHPDYYLKNGKYVDGMLEPEMIDALNRLRDAYSKGLIDTEVITNKTSTARNKFYEGKVGCFNYWAGMWCKTLNQDLRKQDSVGVVVPLEPIAETQYIERPPTALAVTNYAENPYGVASYLCFYTHDGGLVLEDLDLNDAGVGKGQLLFTRGVEGIHYKKAEGSEGIYEKSADELAFEKGFNDSSSGKKYAVEQEDSKEYEYVALTPPASPTSKELVQKAWYSPELSIVNYDDPIAISPLINSSLALFRDNRTINPVPKYNKEIAEVMVEISTIRETVIANVVKGRMSPEEGIEYYRTRLQAEIDVMLEELNGTNE